MAIVSENAHSFWISDCILGLGMTIFKDTPEGIKLQDMIDKEVSIKKIQAWLDSLVFKHAKTSFLIEKIKQEKKILLNKENEQRHRRSGLYLEFCNLI